MRDATEAEPQGQQYLLSDNSDVADLPQKPGDALSAATLQRFARRGLDKALVAKHGSKSKKGGGGGGGGSGSKKKAKGKKAKEKLSSEL